MTSPPTSDDAVLQHLTRACASLGLDLLAGCPVGAYNALVPQGFRLPPWREGRALLVAIGNSGALWQPFLGRLRQDPGLVELEHPLDEVVAAVVEAAVASLGTRHLIAWSNRRQGSPPVGLQHLARATGLACASPVGLCAHPRLGTWFAMRAAVLLDVQATSTAPAELTDPCGSCMDRPCMPAYQHALQVIEQGRSAKLEIRRVWRPWLALRHSCPVGREHAYPEAQSRYHYTKDRGWLRRVALGEHGEEAP